MFMKKFQYTIIISDEFFIEVKYIIDILLFKA